MNALSRAVDEKLGDTQREMSNSLKYQSERSHELIKEITREITEVKKTGEQVMSFTEQLQDLQNMLKNPKTARYFRRILFRNNTQKCAPSWIVSNAIYTYQRRHCRCCSICQR